MKYDLPLPDITDRTRYDYTLNRGDVVAFSRMEYGSKRTGIIVMDSEDSFLAAVNLYREEGYIWFLDTLPDDVTLYKATEEEKDWGKHFFFDYYVKNEVRDDANPIISFIQHECPKDSYYCIGRHDWSFCMEILSSLYKWDYIRDKENLVKELWKEAIKGVDEGVAFNPQLSELYCFLIAIIMIVRSDDIFPKQKYIDELHKNWCHFSWMYAMVIGRLIGTELNTFTAMVNGLHTSRRSKYLHLYLPLAEGNVDKICKYSSVEKQYKLKAAIEKMRKQEELTEQATDMDTLYKVLFPKHFKKAMSERLPAASIQEMKERLAIQEETIRTLNENTRKLEEQLQKVLDDMEKIISETFSLDTVAAAILDMETLAAKFVFSHLDFKLRNDEVWKRGRSDLQDKLEKKEKNERTGVIGMNNGIVAGGNVNATVHFSDEQAKMLVSQLALDYNQQSALQKIMANGNNN